MKITAFKRRPLSIMVNISQDEAWELVRSLVCQMEGNSSNLDRKEYMDVAGQYFSIAVRPDPLRSISGGERNRLISGIWSLLSLFSWMRKHPKDAARIKDVAEIIEVDINPIIEKWKEAEEHK